MNRLYAGEVAGSRIEPVCMTGLYIYYLFIENKKAPCRSRGQQFIQLVHLEQVHLAPEETDLEVYKVLEPVAFQNFPEMWIS